MLDEVAVLVNVVHHTFDERVDIDTTFVVSDDGFLRTIEGQTFTLGARTDFGDVVETEHHVLRRYGHRLTTGWRQDVVRLEHQNLCLKDGFVRQWKVNGHLVTVEVGVECRTSQWVKLDGFAFNHLWLESLDTQTVKGRGTVEQHWMTFHHILQNVPNHRVATVNNLLG